MPPLLMRLENADALLRYLLERELVSRTSAVDGEIVIVFDKTNEHHRVIDRRGGQLFAVSGADAVARERVPHELARDDDRFVAVRALLPEVVAIDEPNELLLLRTFDSANDAVEYQRTTRSAADWLPSLAGRSLAMWHRAAVPLAGDARLRRDFPPALRPSQTTVAPQVAQLIARVAAGWRHSTMINGDFSFERIFIASESDRRVQLAGWEEVRAGDEAWDIAGVIESYYSWSLDPSTIAAVDGPVTNVGGGELRELVTSFWNSYVSTAALPPAEARALLLRAFGYAGARMLTRIERVMSKPESAPSLTRMMQSAMVMLTSPSVVADAFVIPQTPQWPQGPQAWMAR
jgi:hypothetical protein